MSRTNTLGKKSLGHKILGDFDVITGPPAGIRRRPPERAAADTPRADIPQSSHALALPPLPSAKPEDPTP